MSSMYLQIEEYVVLGYLCPPGSLVFPCQSWQRGAKRTSEGLRDDCDLGAAAGSPGILKAGPFGAVRSIIKAHGSKGWKPWDS